MLKYLREGSDAGDLLEMLFSETREAPGRPWVMFNMVSSVDGATAVAGGSTALNDQDDQRLFAAMRALPDVILVGAGTVRAEGYRPVTLDEERRARRVEQGLDPVPRLAIATRSLDLDPDMRIFADPDHKPLVVTGDDAPADRAEALTGIADIVRLPDLGPRSILGALDGARVVLCEGGPTLNGQLMSAGLVDELALTISPVVAVGKSHRVAYGDEPDPPLEMRLDRVLAGDRSLFLRYVRAG